MVKEKKGTKFLFLPKRIDGKIYWLRKVNYTETIETIFFGGYSSISRKRKYYIDKEGDK